MIGSQKSKNPIFHWNVFSATQVWTSTQFETSISRLQLWHFHESGKHPNQSWPRPMTRRQNNIGKAPAQKQRTRSKPGLKPMPQIHLASTSTFHNLQKDTNVASSLLNCNLEILYKACSWRCRRRSHFCCFMPQLLSTASEQLFPTPDKHLMQDVLQNMHASLQRSWMKALRSSAPVQKWFTPPLDFMQATSTSSSQKNRQKQAQTSTLDLVAANDDQEMKVVSWPTDKTLLFS